MIISAKDQYCTPSHVPCLLNILLLLYLVLHAPNLRKFVPNHPCLEHLYIYIVVHSCIVYNIVYYLFVSTFLSIVLHYILVMVFYKMIIKMKLEERGAHLKIHNLLIFAFYRLYCRWRCSCLFRLVSGEIMRTQDGMYV
jgi:hypothetical protein